MACSPSLRPWPDSYQLPVQRVRKGTPSDATLVKSSSEVLQQSPGVRAGKGPTTSNATTHNGAVERTRISTQGHLQPALGTHWRELMQ